MSSRRVLKVVAFSATVIFVVGCGDNQAAIPTKLDQSLPSVVGSDGSGNPNKVEGGKKKGSPGALAD